MDIPREFEDPFDKKKSFGHLSTSMPDGTPQSTPVWCAWDGDDLLVDTTRGRRKLENVPRDPRVSVSIQDPDHPYRSVEVRPPWIGAGWRSSDPRRRAATCFAAPRL